MQQALRRDDEAVEGFHRRLRQVEPLVPRFRVRIGEDNVAVVFSRHGRAIGARGDPLTGAQRIKAGPRSCETIAFVFAIDNGHQAQAFQRRGRRQQRQIGQPQQRHRLPDRSVRHLGACGIVVLTAFERDGVAARRTHELRRADAVAWVCVIEQAACAPPCRTLCIRAHPAIDDARRTQMFCQPAFRRGVRKRLQRAAVVRRAAHDERLAGAAERMQIEQHVVRGKPRAQRVGDVVFINAWRVGWQQATVQVALTHARALCIREWIGHRHQRQTAALDAPATAVEFAQHALDATRARGFIAMHRAKHDELRAGSKAGEVVGSKHARHCRCTNAGSIFNSAAVTKYGGGAAQTQTKNNVQPILPVNGWRQCRAASESRS